MCSLDANVAVTCCRWHCEEFRCIQPSAGHWQVNIWSAVFSSVLNWRKYRIWCVTLESVCQALRLFILINHLQLYGCVMCSCTHVRFYCVIICCLLTVLITCLVWNCDQGLFVMFVQWISTLCHLCCVCVCVSELVQIDTLRGMLDISLFFYTSLIAVFVDVLLALPHLISTICHTQVCHSSNDTVTAAWSNYNL